MIRPPSRDAVRQVSAHARAQRQPLGFFMAATIAAALAMSGPAQAQAPKKGSPEHIKAATSAVDDAAIKANAATTKDWLSYGLDYSEMRFSKLDQVNADTVKTLGLKWSYNLESMRGVEATPIVVDGIMYVTASWSIVHAIDVRTGKRIWTFDPRCRARSATRAAATS